MRSTRRWYLRRDDVGVQANPNGDGTLHVSFGHGYLVDRLYQEVIYDGTGAGGTGNILAITNNFYDQIGSPGTTPTLGELQRVGRVYDAPLAPSTGSTPVHGIDVTYGYDLYGNRSQVTTYSGTSTRTSGV